MSGRQIRSKLSLKSRPVGADASNKLSAALLIKVHELCEQGEIVPAALCTPVPLVLGLPCRAGLSGLAGCPHHFLLVCR